MRLRLAIVGLVAFLAVCGSSAARLAAPSVAVCGPKGAKQLAASHHARVYQLGNAVYGCAAPGGGSFRLGHATRAIAESRVGPVAVAGVVAAYGLTSFGVDTVSAQVVERRLTDGARLHSFAATKAVAAESFQSVGSVVVKADGATAWIAHESSIVGHGQATEVHAARAGASDVVIDSGPGIDASSLRLRGSTLSWREGGITRHAMLR